MIESLQKQVENEVPKVHRDSTYEIPLHPGRFSFKYKECFAMCKSAQDPGQPHADCVPIVCACFWLTLTAPLPLKHLFQKSPTSLNQCWAVFDMVVLFLFRSNVRPSSFDGYTEPRVLATFTCLKTSAPYGGRVTFLLHIPVSCIVYVRIGSNTRDIN